MPEESTIQIPGTKTRVPKAAAIGAAVVGGIALIVLMGRKGGTTAEESEEVSETGLGSIGEELEEEEPIELPELDEGPVEFPPMPEYVPGDSGGYQIQTASFDLGVPKSETSSSPLYQSTITPTGGMPKTTIEGSPKPSTPPSGSGGTKTTVKPSIPPPTTGGEKKAPMPSPMKG